MYLCWGHVAPEAFLASVGATRRKPALAAEDVDHGYLSESGSTRRGKPDFYTFDRHRGRGGTPVTVADAVPYRPLMRVPPEEAWGNLAGGRLIRNHRLLVGEDPEIVWRLLGEACGGRLEEIMAHHGYRLGDDPPAPFVEDLNRSHRLQRREHRDASLTAREVFVLVERLGYGRRDGRSVAELSEMLGLHKCRVQDAENVAAGRVRHRLEDADGRHIGDASSGIPWRRYRLTASGYEMLEETKRKGTTTDAAR